MDSREQAIHGTLHTIDPELAGLFARGCELFARDQEPGVALILGHIGRELSIAVLDVMAREVAYPMAVADSSAHEDTERFREAIARAVELPVDDPRVDSMLHALGEEHRDVIGRALMLRADHPLVTSWLRTQRSLVAVTHYRRGMATPRDRAREAWLALLGILFNRVRPYFDAENELDELLKIVSPGAEDLEQLRNHLVRPQLRLRFYRLLANAAWLEPLKEAGFLDYPPDWIALPDGRFRLVPWPEGECVARFAAEAPTLVSEVMHSIPDHLSNPRVWEHVAKAVTSLPLENARTLVTKLSRVVSRVRDYYLSHTAVEAAKRLAADGDQSALRLCKALLGLRELPPDSGPRETRRFRLKSHALLECMDDYEFGEFLRDVVPILASFRGLETWDLFLNRLSRALDLATASGFEDSDRSQHWCKSLHSARFDDDVRAQFAVAALRTAKGVLRDNTSNVRQLLDSLPTPSLGIFARMQLAILILAGADAAAELDAAISDPLILDPPYGAVEVAELLQSRFSDASPDARATFVSNLRLGPTEGELRAIAEWQGSDPDSADARADALRGWQRKRLRWFNDRLPAELKDLARELEFEPQKWGTQQRALDEVGYHVSGVYTAGDSTPFGVDDLARMSNREIIDALIQWRPDGNAFDGPSRQGLANAVLDLIAQAPDTRTELIRLTSTCGDLHPTYVRLAVKGLRKVAEQQAQVLGSLALETVENTVVLAESRYEIANHDEWYWVRHDALELARDCLNQDRWPAQLLGRITTLTDNALASSLQWSIGRTREVRTFGDVMLEMLNSDGGLTVDLLVATALWMRRIGDPSVVKLSRSHVRDWLELVRRRNDEGRLASRAQLGTYLPWLLNLERDWILANSIDLLEDGMTAPLTNPIWGVYMCSGRVYGDTFGMLRSWFGRFAAQQADLVAAEDAVDTTDSQWSVSRHFLEHAGHAHIAGYLAFGEDDRALETTFESSRAKDRAHFYWQIFRSWKDSPATPDSNTVGRVLSLWSWRLDQLEQSTYSGDVAAEADALGWLILAPHLPASEVVRLATRTLRIGLSEHSTRQMIWPRLAELASHDVRAVSTMAEQLIRAELADEWPHFNFDELAPVFRLAIRSSDNDAAQRCSTLIHLLGDKGWSEFGSLLKD